MNRFKKIVTNPILWIFLLGLILRIYNLSEIPSGFHVDEAKVAWNTYSILKTGKDDWGQVLGLHYNSFGDFRPSGYFYLTVPFVYIFGNNEFSVRFPSAFFGSLSIISLYLLTKTLLGNKDPKTSKLIGYFAALILALSPWHISLSRATSESIVAIFFVITALFLLLKGLIRNSRIMIILSFLTFFLSYFFYHSARIMSPVFAVTLFLWYTQFNLNIIKKYLFAGLIIFGLFISTIVFSLNKESVGRLNQVSIFNDLQVHYESQKYPFEEGTNNVLLARVFHNKLVLYSTRFLDEFAKYFSADFLIGENIAKPIRYQTTGFGVLSYVELFLFIMGLVVLANRSKKYSLLPLALLLLAPLPAALTTEDAPNLQRSSMMIPFISILCALGIYHLLKNKIRILNLGLIAIFFLGINFIYYCHMYFIHNPVHAPIPMYRNDGAKEAALKLQEVKSSYDIIYVGNSPDELYPWYAFFNKVDPVKFNEAAKNRTISGSNWTYENIVFYSNKCPSEYVFAQPPIGKNILAIDNEGCSFPLETGILVYEVHRKDGGTPYKFITYNGGSPLKFKK